MSTGVNGQGSLYIMVSCLADYNWPSEMFFFIIYGRFRLVKVQNVSETGLQHKISNPRFAIWQV